MPSLPLQDHMHVVDVLNSALRRRVQKLPTAVNTSERLDAFGLRYHVNGIIE